MKTSVFAVSRRRRWSASSEVDSMFESMARQVLTAQLIVDKHRAMVLANVTFKALAAIWRRHADMRRVKYTRNYGHYKNVNRVFVLSVSDTVSRPK